MNLRDFLALDLGQLMGFGPPRKHGRKRRKRPWRGPLYLGATRWRWNLLLVTHQLACVVKANAPLAQGLEVAATDAPNRKVEAILLVLRDDLEAGLSLGEAMDLRPRFFRGDYVDLIKAGERTGSLTESLDRLLDELEGSVSWSDIWLGYLAYPVFVLAFSWLLVFGFMYRKIFPVFVEIHSELGTEFYSDSGTGPRFGPLLMDVGHAARLWWVVAVAACLVVLAYKLVPRLLRIRPQVRHLTRRIVLTIPLVGAMVAKHNLARASFILERDLGGDIPLDAALQDLREEAIGPVYAAAFARLGRRVAQGTPLVDAMEKEKRVLPRSFRSLVALGESSGLLPETLGEIARMYYRDAVKLRTILTEVTFPILILCAGSFTLLATLATYEMTTVLVEALIDSM